MGMFDTLTNAINTGKEQYAAAEDAAYAYVGSKVPELHESATGAIDKLDERASDLNTTIRNGADELIDDMAERNQEFYTGMKDDVKDRVVVVSSALGMEETGKALNEKIDSGAEIVQSAGEALTDRVQDKIKNVGTLNRERQSLNRAINALPTNKIENETARLIAEGAKSSIKNVVNTNLTDIPAVLAKTSIDGAALAIQTKIAMRDPFPVPGDLKIGQKKTVAANIKLKAHIGVGGGVQHSLKFTLERKGEDDFEATFEFATAGKVGIGESVGKGIDTNIGTKVGSKISIRGSAKMIEALKESYENGEILDMNSLRKMSPEEIRIGGEIANFIDASAVLVSGELAIGVGVEAVWTKKEGLHAELSATAKVSPQIGFGISSDLPFALDVPNLAASFELKGTVKTNGTIELKATAEGLAGSKAVIIEGKTSIDLSNFPISETEILTLIDKGEFSPKAFGLKFDFEINAPKVIRGGVSLDTPLGGVKNQITEKNILYKTPASIKAFQMGVRL